MQVHGTSRLQRQRQRVGITIETDPETLRQTWNQDLFNINHVSQIIQAQVPFCDLQVRFPPRWSRMRRKTVSGLMHPILMWNAANLRKQLPITTLKYSEFCCHSGYGELWTVKRWALDLILSSFPSTNFSEGAF